MKSGFITFKVGPLPLPRSENLGVAQPTFKVIEPWNHSQRHQKIEHATYDKRCLCTATTTHMLIKIWFWYHKLKIHVFAQILSISTAMYDHLRRNTVPVKLAPDEGLPKGYNMPLKLVGRPFRGCIIVFEGSKTSRSIATSVWRFSLQSSRFWYF